MIAVAAVSPERRSQPANFRDAILERVARPRNKVTGYNGQIGRQIVCHVHRASHVLARNVSAQMNVAQLRDLHSVERIRQIGHRNFHPPDMVIQTLRSEAIHGAEERRRTGCCRRSFKEMPPSRIGHKFSCFADRRSWRRLNLFLGGYFPRDSPPNSLQPAH